MPDLAAVHAEHVDFVWATLQRLGIRDADLEDVTQNVFIVIHRRLHTFDPGRSMIAWLYGVCRRVAARHRRQAHMLRECPLEEVTEDVQHKGLGPDDAVQTRDAGERLEKILDGLDPLKRVVFVMFEIDEIPCKDIAEQLGIPVGTVYSRLDSARKAFERALARQQARDAAGGDP